MATDHQVTHYAALAAQAADWADDRHLSIDDARPEPPIDAPVVPIEEFSDELAANCMSIGQRQPLTACPRRAVLAQRIMPTYTDADLLSVALMAAHDGEDGRCADAVRELVARYKRRHEDDKPRGSEALDAMNRLLGVRP